MFRYCLTTTAAVYKAGVALLLGSLLLAGLGAPGAQAAPARDETPPPTPMPQASTPGAPRLPLLDLFLLPDAFPVAAPAVFREAAAASGAIVLDFNTLPSAQGWTYVPQGNSVPETSVFWVSDGQLRQNTLGVGFAPQGSNRYDVYNRVAADRPFTLTVRARVAAEEHGPPGYPQENYFGFAFGAFTGAEVFAVGLGPRQIQDAHNRVVSTALDNTQFHTYRLEGTPGVG